MTHRHRRLEDLEDPEDLLFLESQLHLTFLRFQMNLMNLMFLKYP
jgi:hypothetical protein